MSDTRTYTVTFADGVTHDYEATSMSSARRLVSHKSAHKHGGVVGIVRAGTGYAVVKTGMSDKDVAWLAEYAGINGTTAANEDNVTPTTVIMDGVEYEQ